MASPKRSSALVEQSPVYYGWVVLTVATLGMAATLPGQTAGISLFIDAFIKDLGLSRSAVSWLYTGATVLGSLGLPLAGRLLDRYGPRRVAVVLIALLAASCAGMRWVSGWDWARPGPRRSSRPSWKGAARPTAGRRRV